MLVDTQSAEQHAKRIAQIVAKSARGFFRNLLDIELKSDESPVTQADKAIEQEVRAYLELEFPKDGILGEEFGRSGLEEEYVWSIDPIDGTRSFLSGHPLFGFLLARLHNGRPTLGVIGMPALDETIIANDARTTLNGETVRVSSTTSLDQAVLYVNEGEKMFGSHPEVFATLMTSGQTRRFGYDCYPHALVAMGHVDAVIDFDLQPYDYLPLVPIIQSAGGVISDWAGQALTLNTGPTPVITAATPELHAQLLQIVSV
ncbi:inositol monophosphatase family protein [Aliiroseovarius sp. 2305UL8-7]|uniref:inositol monophosphatase family protein n=1 Tax=Aliiroseovarius conchicola TaxID=3121637 RepID=UPI003526D7A1